MNEPNARRSLPLVLTFALSAAVVACGGGGGGGDDDDDDGPRTDLFPGVEVDESLSFDALSDQVDVVVDGRGTPHIYASTVEDALFVQGYLMSRDRFAQMDFTRRLVLGRLTEVVGDLSTSLVASDATNRFRAYGRRGRAVYEALDPDEPARRYADAFVAGVNAYVAEVAAGTADPDPALNQLALIFLYTSESFGPWEPADIFALAAFFAYSLANELTSDLAATLRLEANEAAFPADAEDPGRAARAGWYSDVLGVFPARRAYTLDGIPNVGMDSGTRALLPPGGPGDPEGPSPAPTSLGELLGAGAVPALRQALATLTAVAELRTGVLGGEFTGSNNWLVSGDLTASGRPIVSNDPHLELTSPAVWWMTHLNTTRRGGDLDVQGFAFAGIPGVVLGSNPHLAWGVTTANFDVTDAYLEEVVPGDGDTPTTVLFQGEQVPVETVEETIRTANGDEVTFELEVVPHHGVIVQSYTVDEGGELVVDRGYTPDGEGGFRAVSTRYTGDTFSNEIAAFIGLWTAETIADAEVALESFQVGAQNFIVADRDGRSFYSAHADIPVREEGTCTWAVNPETHIASGVAPFFVLPGTGGFEWTGEIVDDRFVPHAVDPEDGFLATANQDLVGAVDDGTPCNDAEYIGWDFAPGWRQFRISERLGELADRGGITVEDMTALQGETQSQTGRTSRDVIVAALDRVDEEYDAGGTHPDLSDLVADAPDRRADLADVRRRLAAWSLETPHGWRSDDANEIADSVATTLFEVTMSRLVLLVLADEVDEQARAVGATFSEVAPDNLETIRTIERLLCWGPGETVAPSCVDIDPPPLATYDDELGGSILFDDLRTPGATETRDERIGRAVLATLAFLEDRFGDVPDEDWRWFTLHDTRFVSVIPATTIGSTDDILSIPADGSDFPNDGYPRAGGFGAVDVCNWQVWPSGVTALEPGEDLPYVSSFRCRNGPSMRVVQEVQADRVDAVGVLSGGQSIFPESPFKDDEGALWWQGETRPLAFDDETIAAEATRRLQFD